MTVAIGWSGYFQRILGRLRPGTLPAWMSAAPGHDARRGSSTCPAVLIVLAITALLVVGIRESARFNAVMVAIKLAAVLFFCFAGFSSSSPRTGRRSRPTAGPASWPARGSGLLRLHRLRRRLHHGRGGQEPAARPADRHHRLARHLHGPLHRWWPPSSPGSCRSPTTAARGRAARDADRAARPRAPPS